MPESKRPKVLITGASSGIGKSLAKVFAGNQYDLVLVARNKEKLQQLSSELSNTFTDIQIQILDKDLTKIEAAKEIYDEIPEIDILVNNAGMAVHGEFSKTDFDKELQLIQLNIIALVRLTKLYLPHMIARNDGKILMVSSIVSVMSVPREVVYAASKSFVLSFTESLNEELKGSRVAVAALLPGATETPIFEKANADNARFVTQGKLDDPDEVAKIAFEGLIKGKKIIIPGIINKAIVKANQWLPSEFLSLIKQKMMEDVK